MTSIDNITASLIRELRSRTGVGFLECKRALVEENGNIELSIDNLRKSGKLSAEKKINNITNQGKIFAQTQNNVGVLLELNCETDFVAKDDAFIFFGEDIILTALEKNIKDINQLKSMFEEKRTDLVLKVGENINIRRFQFLEGENISYYVHGVRIGVLVDANFSNKKILKSIAMHIAASKPEYLHPKNVTNTVFEREYQIQLELAKNLQKPANVLKKIIEGKMNKFVNNISLTSQSFIIDPTKKVGDVLNEYNGCIKSFIRFELGEIILQ
ncbi:elongation factor Ts [Buchnera aphidicola (Hyperomyzus lactucae)]|uniref:Elongation factor Ts n=1 Tax=Buchnera aphidicola (Hyperomyzus lactucae) TaxID=1241860 RepID=A0A4D6Y4M5_9GAMM|nr:translation elongation factor Ts [Buchnera aphidicola]QCI20960.1 elongation factor Ts [Buchnera aphidicola (Hyperomyzus lactucae)]